MKRTMLVLGMVLALAMTAMAASGEYEYPDPSITSPTAGEVIYENTLYLEASDPNVLEAGPQDVHWAVVTETEANPMPCTGTIHFNRNNTPYTFEGGEFRAEVDLTGLTGGEYCFVFNTELENPADGARIWNYFYIVDEYAKVGGNVDNADYLIESFGSLGLKELRGNQLSHAFEGVVGNAGSKTVGSITVNYRQLDKYVTFYGQSLTLSAAGGIDVDDSTARAAVMAVGGSEIILLDKDASPDFERGAAIVRYDGAPSKSKYEIDSTPGDTGADSWVPLVNGNVEVGIR